MATSHPEKACPVPGPQPRKPHSCRGPSRDSGPPGFSDQMGRGLRVGEGTGGSQQQQGALLSLGLPVSLVPWEREGSFGMGFAASDTRPIPPSLASERIRLSFSRPSPEEVLSMQQIMDLMTSLLGGHGRLPQRRSRSQEMAVSSCCHPSEWVEPISAPCTDKNTKNQRSRVL